MTDFKVGDCVMLGDNPTNRAVSELSCTKLYHVRGVTSERIELVGAGLAGFLKQSFKKIEPWEACVIMGVNQNGIKPGDQVIPSRGELKWDLEKGKPYKVLAFDASGGDDCMILEELQQHGGFPTEWFAKYDPDKLMIDRDMIGDIIEPDPAPAQDQPEEVSGDASILSNAIKNT